MLSRQRREATIIIQASREVSIIQMNRSRRRTDRESEDTTLFVYASNRNAHMLCRNHTDWTRINDKCRVTQPARAVRETLSDTHDLVSQIGPRIEAMV